MNSARLVSQYSLFGVAATIAGQSVRVCHTAPRSSKSLRSGGLAGLYDMVVRVRKRDLTAAPLLEAAITVNSVSYRIKEIVDHPQSGEYRLGVRGAVE